VFFFISLAVLALFWFAFVFILRDDHKKKSLIFIAVVIIIVYCFPACFLLSWLYIENAFITSKVLTIVLGLNLAILSALVTALLLSEVTEVLLVSVIVALY
jgi:hypothetical protein